MEEKKLTDEEIVKSLENCATVGNCQECPYFIKDIDCREQRAENDYLDLIHRLQDENEDLKAKQKCHFELIDDKNEEICKQKAEIERLTEERENMQAEIIATEETRLQAVKDTAKEIYSEIGDDDILVITTQEYGKIEVVPLERLQEIVKGKGVEVE